MWFKVNPPRARFLTKFAARSEANSIAETASFGDVGRRGIYNRDRGRPAKGGAFGSRVRTELPIRLSDLLRDALVCDRDIHRYDLGLVQAGAALSGPARRAVAS